MQQSPSSDNILQHLSTWPIELLVTAACVGFITMTIIELNKIWLRSSFHRSILWRWMDVASLLNPLPKGAKQDMSFYYHNVKLNDAYKKEASRQLIMCSTGGNPDTFYALPIEGLCGQIAVGAQAMLESPSKYREGIYCLIGGSKLADVELDADVKNLEKIHFTNEGSSDLIASRARISTHIQRRIDSLQIDAGFKWKQRLRYLSMVISFCLSFMSLFFISDADFLWLPLFLVLTAYIGTFMASIFSDLVSSLEKLKK